MLKEGVPIKKRFVLLKKKKWLFIILIVSILIISSFFFLPKLSQTISGTSQDLISGNKLYGEERNDYVANLNDIYFDIIERRFWK